MKEWLNILRKMEPSNAKMVKLFGCPHCGISGIGDTAKIKANLIGWCETINGIMIVVECPCCFGKYRFHPVYNVQFDKEKANTAIDELVERNYFGNTKQLKTNE